MKTLSIAIETYSGLDLAKCGVYAYTESKDFEILLFGYAFDDETAEVVDLKMGEKLPQRVIDALADPDVVKTAFNANFARTCINAFFKLYIEPEQWRCTEVMALRLGLPGSHEKVGKYLGLEQGKLAEGRALVRHFSMPSSIKGKKVRNLPGDDPVRWEEFKSCCIRTVEVERSIREPLDIYFETEMERELWCLDQSINDRGVAVNIHMINSAIDMEDNYRKRLLEQGTSLTGLHNLNSGVQLKKWLEEYCGMSIESLSKENLEDIIEKAPDVRVIRVLELKRELSMTSVKKYRAMKNALCSDGRIRGLFQFYGASRTGRWAGRLVQVQNLPKICIDNVDKVRKLLISGREDLLELRYGSVTEVLSQLIRTAFVPKKGCRFIISDFSAIEARILSWLADESWRMDVFRSHGKIYEASAARMFNVPMESIDRDSPLRQKGKIAELALGYQGGSAALEAMGAAKLGLTLKELDELVAAWRSANQRIVSLWREVEEAALWAVRDENIVRLRHGIVFYPAADALFIKLPSGRCLSYLDPRIERDKVFNRPVLTYEGVTSDAKKWGRITTYGGKLVENITQAIARDCLGEVMLRLEDSGYMIVMHIHDEVVLEMPYGHGKAELVKDIMELPFYWAKGLELRAEVFEGKYYCK